MFCMETKDKKKIIIIIPFIAQYRNTMVKIAYA